MSDSRLIIEVSGADVTDELLGAGARVEVEEALDDADAASISVGVAAGADGEWTSGLDDLTFPDAELSIGVSSADRSYSFAGLVAGATWTIDTDGASQLVVRAVDRTAEMDRVEQVVAWPGAADSTIASSIFAAYGFATVVEATPAGPDPTAYTPVQRGTDWAFLRSLAAKWGYATFVEVEGTRTVGHFRPINPLAAPSETLLLGFGGDSFIAEVEVEFSGGRVRADRIPPLSDGVVSAEAQGEEQLQGSESLATAATTLLGPGDVEGEIEPAMATAGRARQRAFGVRLTATTDPIRRGPLLRARRTVDVKGLGSRLSGLYLVSRVRHQLSQDHHHQQVTLIRNALGAVGSPVPGVLP